MIQVVDAMRMPGPPGSSNVLAAPVGTEDAPRTVGPFALVAHLELAPVEPGALPVDADVRPHPHIGLAAISYLLEGHITHRDSLGNRQELGPGSVGLLVAGRGVVHSERFERLRLHGGRLALFQMLLALPDGAEEVEPSFRHLAAMEVPIEETDGVTVRWPACPSGAVLADASLDPGALWSPPEGVERAAYVLSGAAMVGDARVGTGQTALLPPGAPPLRAIEPTRLLLFGGAPAGPRWMWWNYLHSSLARIEEARAAWREGRVALPKGDTESFTPAPPDDGRPLRRLNG
jgi:redox-sensitive bicupin YhaK (pirin superfamily)